MAGRIIKHLRYYGNCAQALVIKLSIGSQLENIVVLKVFFRHRMGLCGTYRTKLRMSYWARTLRIRSDHGVCLPAMVTACLLSVKSYQTLSVEKIVTVVYFRSIRLTARF